MVAMLTVGGRVAVGQALVMERPAEPMDVWAEKLCGCKQGVCKILLVKESQEAGRLAYAAGVEAMKVSRRICSMRAACKVPGAADTCRWSLAIRSTLRARAKSLIFMRYLQAARRFVATDAECRQSATWVSSCEGSSC